MYYSYASSRTKLLCSKLFYTRTENTSPSFFFKQKTQEINNNNNNNNNNKKSE